MSLAGRNRVVICYAMPAITPADPLIAVAYLRVSTDAETQALGLAAQKAAIASWAAREGIAVAGWHTETISGGAPLHERTGLLAALAALKVHGAGLLIVQRIDRFSRDLASALAAEQALVDAGARLAVVEGGGGGLTSDPSAEFMRTILLGAAKFERELIRARIKAALAAKRSKGDHMGAAPFGYRLSTTEGRTTLTPHAGEQATLTALRALRAEGLSYRQILPRAAAAGLVSRTGRPFRLARLAALLRAEGPETPGAFAPKCQALE